MKTIGFIGAGRMATALACGIAKADLGIETMLVADPQTTAIEQFRESLGSQVEVSVVDGNQGVVDEAEAVILAVKPQVLGAALGGLNFQQNPLWISVVAGCDLEQLYQRTRSKRCVCVMPNTPSLIGMGACGYALGDEVGQVDARRVKQFLDAVGLAIEVRPDLINAVTGVSGSGPAYVYTFIEALIDGGVRAGLYRQDARQLAIQTVVGAAKMLELSGDHPAFLRDQVTSPGGTTIAAVQALEAAGFRNAIISAVTAASERARELGELGDN